MLQIGDKQRYKENVIIFGVSKVHFLDVQGDYVILL